MYQNFENIQWEINAFKIHICKCRNKNHDTYVKRVTRNMLRARMTENGYFLKKKKIISDYSRYKQMPLTDKIKEITPHVRTNSELPSSIRTMDRNRQSNFFYFLLYIAIKEEVFLPLYLY